jgi:hypothetical protein
MNPDAGILLKLFDNAREARHEAAGAVDAT